MEHSTCFCFPKAIVALLHPTSEKARIGSRVSREIGRSGRVVWRNVSPFDIRNLPEVERRETAAMIAHKPVPSAAAPTPKAAGEDKTP